MSPFAASLTAQLVLSVVAVVAATAASSDRTRNALSGAALALLGGAGVASGALALGGATGTVQVSTALDGVTVGWGPTPLGGLFTLVAGAVTVLAAVYGIGYAHGAAASRTAWTALVVFVLGMQLVPLATDIIAFLLAWEAMAIGSTILVLTEHAQRPTVRPAGLWYATVTHLSFLVVAAGLAVLAAEAGTTSFQGIAASGVSGPVATSVFVLTVVGFAAKAGAVPLHVWLPRAHPEAPSHVSALMSAAMVNMGIFGILLVATVLLPDGPGWWGLVVLALGVPSALYGILQASVASDLKRLLAYSTTENIGLILIAVAVSLLARGSRPGVAATALFAALLLTVSHAAFKATLFLSAGAILHATGERDLDRMGGLAVRMPLTTLAFAVGALGAAALPVTSGFVAEWTLLQSIIHADARTDRLVTALLPLVMGVVALTAGLALLTFTKAFGIATLARPRSEAVAAAREIPATMWVAQLLGAGTVLTVGMAPGLVGSALADALPAGTVATTSTGALSLSRVDAQLDPVSLTLLALTLTLPVVTLAVVLARRVPRRHVDLGWGCGGVRTSARMQYTATSYAEPLVRVFDDALSPTRDVTVSHAEESRHTVQAMAYSQRVVDVVETRLYAPAVAALVRLGDLARRVQNGSIHRYVGFSFAALLLVLVGVMA